MKTILNLIPAVIVASIVGYNGYRMFEPVLAALLNALGGSQ